VTLAAVGACTIQATQAGNADYAAATPVGQGFQVTQESQIVNFGGALESNVRRPAVQCRRDGQFRPDSKLRFANAACVYGLRNYRDAGRRRRLHDPSLATGRRRLRRGHARGSELPGGPVRERSVRASMYPAYATAARPFLATRTSSFSEAPCGCFSPRSHWLTRPVVTLR